MKGTDPPRYIFRASITLKSGKKIYASWYGLKAFKIPVSDNDNEEQPKQLKLKLR